MEMVDRYEASTERAAMTVPEAVRAGAAFLHADLHVMSISPS